MRTSHFAAFLGVVAITLLGAPGCTTEHVETTDNTRERVALPGLEAPVDVDIDERGMPHIYGESLHDVSMVQGYLMARDRFPEMEMIRREVTGRLAEFLGKDLSPEILQTDIAARVIGWKRVADRIYASLDAADPEKMAVDAFAEGVNIHLRAVRDGTEPLPEGSGVLTFLLDHPEAFTDWTPEDSIAIGRYLSYALSYSADDEVTLTSAKEAAATKFPVGDPREGIFRDFWSFAPAEAEFTRNGFPDAGSGSGARGAGAPGAPSAGAGTPRSPVLRGAGQLASPRSPKGPPRAAANPPAEVLTSARHFFAIMGRLRERFGDESRGSNNWVVSGSKTASGAPLLANDPHLSLPAPPLFWYSHLNTQRAGGDLNVEGISLAGAPGVILGYNDQIAWGSTTANHDVTDVYEEAITEGTNGAADTVHFNGTEVPIEIIKETIKVADAEDVVIELENVPHHGIIIPTMDENGMIIPRTSSTALSVRWTGNDVSREITAFLGLDTAKSLEEARAALDSFEVGAQSFVIASRDGDIFWSSQSRIPVRSAAAMAYNPDHPESEDSFCPAMVLPGDGTAEWTGNLDEAFIPYDLNPERGFIATANNDLVGVTADGNPFDDAHYAGWDYDIGHRVSRITDRLTELTEAGGVTPEDMMSIQGDHHSPLGERLTPRFVAAAKRAAEEHATPGKHPDLSAAVAGASAADISALADAASRLEGWTSFETPPGVDIGDGEPTAAEVDDSIATAIFNASVTRVAYLAFNDEITKLEVNPGSSNIAKVLEWAMLDPQRLATYSATLGDTVLWDDLTTTGVTESRDDRIVRGLLGAIQFLRTNLGDDINDWRWGRLHTITFEAIVPSIGTSTETIPSPNDPSFPDGFPRPGDNFGVDASNYGLWSQKQDNFTYGSGPVQRLVVEMTADGPRAWNALPGGQAYDPKSTHHADEAEYWRRNEAPPLYFTDDDVKAHVESALTYVP